MVKLLALLGLLGVVFVAVIWRNETYNPRDNVENSLSYDFPSVPNPETLGASTTSSPELKNVYSDEVLGIRIKYPDEVVIKETSKGNLEIVKDSLKIEITSDKLSEKDTVNTVAEKFIDEISSSLGDKFKLIDTISPISIGSITAITFNTEESSREITYFYIPRTYNFVKIKNSTDTADRKMISLSDEIIYSLELL